MEVDKILDILRDVRPETAFTPESRLFEEGLLDSFDLVLLVGMLEERCGVQVPGDQILPERFATPATIAALVQQISASA